MQTIVLVIHLMIALALVSVILLQRSGGGALSGLGGGETILRALRIDEQPVQANF